MKPIVFLLLLLISLPMAQAQDVPPSKHPKSKSWQDLFQPDLSNALNPDGVWTFEDGILTASEDKNIFTKKVYDNFILDLEFKTAEGTNSGVVVYCSDTDNWIPNSVEIQIEDNHANDPAHPSPWPCGSIYGHLAANEVRVKKPGK